MYRYKHQISIQSVSQLEMRYGCSPAKIIVAKAAPLDGKYGAKKRWRSLSAKAKVRASNENLRQHSS
jgi:hypothetical protein